MRASLAGFICLFCLLALALPAPAAEAVLLLEASPLRGFRFYAGRELWDEMRAGDALQLVRERGDRRDAWAVRVDWRGRKLGYLPRGGDRAVALEMDRGSRVEARIARLLRHRDPWKRIEVEVSVVR